jgi:hypothetical protein
VTALWPELGRTINSLKLADLFLSSMGNTPGVQGPLSLDPKEQSKKWYSAEHSRGFEFVMEKGGKWGWICAANCTAGEHITFSVDYALYSAAGYNEEAEEKAEGTIWTIGFLASYEGMGVFDARTVCTDPTGEITAEATVEVDGQWERKASVYSDSRLLAVGSAVGVCNVTVTSRAAITGRSGNKVKVLALAVGGNDEQ